MIARTDEEKKQLRAAGIMLAGVLDELSAMVREGGNAAELDLAAGHLIRSRGAEPAFLGYQPEGADSPYPAVLCVSVNDEVVHGLPTEGKMFRRGDVVSLDLGLSLKGFFVDAARTLCVDACDAHAAKLLSATREALDAALGAARAGARSGDVGAAIVRTALKHRLGVVKDLGGHGVGKAVHEEPHIPNEGREGEGEELREGMVLAIEPMLCEGRGDIITAPDGWTIKMRDRSRAAHLETTVIVGKDAPEVLVAYA